MGTLYGLIPAAGKGTRAYPYTHRTPKGMLRINGVPNIERNLAIMREQLGIRDVCIILGDHGERIREHFGGGARCGVRITYVQNDAIDRGLAYSVLLGRPHIDDYCCVMLSDECYIGTNHAELMSFPYRTAIATCGVLEVDDPESIRRNYAVDVDGDRITRLIEKPARVENRLLGSGTFVLSPRFFEVLDQAFATAGGRPVDLVTTIGAQCVAGETVRCFRITGTYININDRDSLQLAKYHVRERESDRASVALLVYSEGDERDIELTLAEYGREPRIGSISVVVPAENQVEATIEAAGAAVIRCPPDLTLYGEKLRYALDRMSGDVIMLTDANYSFHARDVAKLLAYMPDADMVIGTRTTRQLIGQASTMRGVVRLANILLAKMIEVLWWRFDCRFTDVGCTFRAVWRSALDTVAGTLAARGPEFSAEMMLALLEARERIIEIPVSYHTRSYSMYRKYRNVRTFWRMLWLILRRRLRRSGG
ncbi:MAG: sugar phosphate nucleotidyltransferase [Candidatus Eiseniibacteriota bacterium]|jgi:dTDP-glucose pyrophosphorylase